MSANERRSGGERRNWTKERGGREANGEVVGGGGTGGGPTADPQTVVGDAARAVGTGGRIVSAELQREKRRTSAAHCTCLTDINM